MGKLTAKQERFIDEYLIDLNATQAAIRAGYSKKTAEVIACENLRKPKLHAIIEQRKKDIAQRLREQFAIDAVVARKVMYSILENEESADKDRITVAKDFLDRAGYKPIDELKLSGAVDINPYKNLTEAELRKLADVGG